jgi:hypothetical protein
MMIRDCFKDQVLGARDRTLSRNYAAFRNGSNLCARIPGSAGAPWRVAE